MQFSYEIYLTVLGMVFTISWLWSRRKFYYMTWKIPGPICLPFIGIGLYFINKNEILNTIGKFVDKFGKCFFFFLGLKPFLLITDPEIIEQIYNTENALQKMDIYNPLTYFLGDSLFVSKDEKWMHNRKLINKAFTHKILVSFFTIFNNQGRIMKNKIIRKFVGKGECYILDEISTCTLYTTAITTMGLDPISFESETEKALMLVNWVKTIQDFIVERMFDPILDTIYRIRPIRKKFDCLREDIFQFVDEAITSRFIMLSKEEHEINSAIDKDRNVEDINITKGRSILIDQLYEFYKNDNFTWADVQSEAAGMMVGAYKTTAYTLYNCLLLLAMNQNYQNILYEEIISICPEDDSDVTYDNLRQMPYIELVLNETMRVVSTVPIVGRKLKNDMILKNGLFIAKGTNVCVDLFHLHRDKRIWGPNSLQFNPDNFLKKNIQNKNPYSFIPFTKGIRYCIGWRYAMLSLKIALVHIIKEYEVKTTWRLEDLKYKMTILTAYNNKPKIEFSHRNKSLK